MPMNATPIVAIVVQLLPVRIEIKAHTVQAINRNMVGLRILRPYSIRIGTTPESIHVAETVAMKISSGTAGKVCRILRLIPSRKSLLRNVREHTPDTTATDAAACKAQGPNSDTLSAPKNTITHTMASKRNMIGIDESNTDGAFAAAAGRAAESLNLIIYLP